VIFCSSFRYLKIIKFLDMADGLPKRILKVCLQHVLSELLTNMARTVEYIVVGIMLKVYQHRIGLDCGLGVDDISFYIVHYMMNWVRF